MIQFILVNRTCRFLFGLLILSNAAAAQSLDFSGSVYYTAAGNNLQSSENTLSSFDYNNTTTEHPLFNDGLYYPINDALGRNLWVRVRYVSSDPNGPSVGHSVVNTQSSPFRSGGFGGWWGFLYRFDIYRDVNFIGQRANTLGPVFRTSITVESIETLSDTEWVYFEIEEDPTVTWTLNSINFTGNNPSSNPLFAGSMLPYNDAGFSEGFPSASKTISVIDGAGGGYSEFSMTAVGVSSFFYGYEYSSAGGYQGMTLSFGALILLPTITSITPLSGEPGTEVTITGTNFSGQPSNNFVAFGGVAAEVIASTPTTLTVIVPEGGISGPISVTVDENIVHSTSSFNVIHNEVETPVDEVKVFNAVSPNNDGLNDFFLILNIEKQPETRSNKVVIINRWGDVVFSVDNYDNQTNVFKGLSSNEKQLPSGVYYYQIDMPAAGRHLTGYLHLKY